MISVLLRRRLDFRGFMLTFTMKTITPIT